MKQEPSPVLPAARCAARSVSETPGFGHPSTPDASGHAAHRGAGSIGVPEPACYYATRGRQAARQAIDLALGGYEVQLRPAAVQDAPLITRWRAPQGDVAPWMFSDPPTLETCRRWLQARDPARRAEFIIEIGQPEADGILRAYSPVGTCGLSDIDRADGRAEYGILLGEAATRQRGIARRAGQLLLGRAWSEYGRTMVIARLYADNLRSLRHLQGVGFVVVPGPPEQHRGRALLRMAVWPGQGVRRPPEVIG